MERARFSSRLFIQEFHMFRSSIFTLIYLLLFGSLHNLYGENDPPLTREQAVQLALNNNKYLIAAKTSIDQARARRIDAGRLNNPELKLQYSSDRTFNNEGESAFGIGFEQRFPITHRLRILKIIADIEIELAEAEILNHQHLLIGEVKRTYLDLAHNKAQRKLRESLIDLNQKFASFIESRIQTGEASSVDVNQIKIELYAVDQEMQQLENEYTEKLSRFRNLLGSKLGTSLEVGFDFTRHHSLSDMPVFSTDHLEKHPEYRMKMILLEIAEHHVSLERSRRWEDIAVEVFYENERTIDEPYGAGRDSFLGVSLSIPLPLMNRNQGSIEESRAYQRQLKLELDSISLNIRTQVDTARQKVSRLYTQANRYEEDVTGLVKQNLKDMNAAYSTGQISLTDLFRSQEQQLKIESRHLEILHDYQQALVNWTIATAQNYTNQASL